MKAILLLSTLLWAAGLVRAQERGHYELVSINESVQGTNHAITIASWEPQKIEITVQKPAGTSLDVRILSVDRQVLFSNRAYKLDQRYRQVLNVSQLEPGRYWLEIQIGNELTRRELRLESTEQTYKVITMH